MTTTLLASFPSPAQGVWYLGPIPIRAYALFILAGVIAALFIGNKRFSARGGEPGVIFDIALWAIIFGLIGGRLYHVLTDWSTYFGPGGAGLVAAFKIQEGGLGIWGAVALGGVGAWIGCRRKGIPLPAFGDAIAPGIVLAQAIGRIGNYFNQELYGRSTSLPWGLEIYERRDSHGAVDSLNGVSTGQLIEIVHPTFLYELIWNLLVFALLLWVDRRFRIGHGRLFALYVAAYCFGRFWIELMRSDMATHIAGIRINSFVSMFVFIGAVIYIMVAPKGREDPSELRGYADVEEKESPVEEVTKELAAVAATTGVVAAAKAAGEREDEDAAETDRFEADADAEAEDANDKPESEAEDSSEDEAVPVAEAEQLAEDVETAPAEDIAEAEAFAEAGEEAEAAEAAGGVGAVEGDEVVEAEEAAPEVHEAAVESAEEAAEVADEVAAEQPEDSAEPAAEAEGADSDETEDAEDQAEPAADESPEPEAGESPEPEAEAVGGVGAVEGDEVVEAEEAAPEVHEAAVEDAEESAAVADEVSDEAPDESESESSESDDAAEPAEQPADEKVDESAESDSDKGSASEAAPEVDGAAVEPVQDAEGADAEVGRTRRRFGFRRRRST